MRAEAGHAVQGHGCRMGAAADQDERPSVEPDEHFGSHHAAHRAPGDDVLTGDAVGADAGLTQVGKGLTLRWLWPIAGDHAGKRRAQRVVHPCRGAHAGEEEGPGLHRGEFGVASVVASTPARRRPRADHAGNDQCGRGSSGRITTRPCRSSRSNRQA